MNAIKNVRLKTLILFLLIYICNDLHGQTKFWNAHDAYLGEKPPGDMPKIFAPGRLVDTGYFACDRPAFSKDGNEFYYCSNNTPFDRKNLTIRYFKYIDGKWNGPKILNEHYFAPVFSPNDNEMYLSGGSADWAVWQTRRDGENWTEVQTFLPVQHGLYDMWQMANGKIYGATYNFKDAPKNQIDICLLTVSGRDTVTRSLGVPVNTTGWNGDFFIAPDETFMIVSAQKSKTGDSELCISYHKPDDTWTNPKSLGPKINTGLAHRWGEYVTPDKKYLFYTYGTSDKHIAIYWVRFDDLLSSLKYTNFDPYVLNTLPDQRLTEGQHFSLKIPDNTFMDDDGNNTLSYSAMIDEKNALPGWLKFDEKTRVLSGTPVIAGTYTIKVKATDAANASAACDVLLIVKGK